jgi:hypothetical protein
MARTGNQCAGGSVWPLRGGRPTARGVDHAEGDQRDSDHGQTDRCGASAVLREPTLRALDRGPVQRGATTYPNSGTSSSTSMIRLTEITLSTVPTCERCCLLISVSEPRYEAPGKLSRTPIRNVERADPRLSTCCHFGTFVGRETRFARRLACRLAHSPAPSDLIHTSRVGRLISHTPRVAPEVVVHLGC